MGELAGVALRGAAAAAFSVVAFGALSACAGAQEAESPLKSAAKALGFATDVGPPADFVAASRPKGALDYIPVFATPAEPPAPAISAKEQKAISEELGAVNERAETLLGAAQPSAKPKTSVRKPVKKPLADDNAPASGGE